jgi:hypothetical protein
MITMANFFLDNDDIRFHFDHLDVRRAAAIMEDDFHHAKEFDEAPEDADEAVDRYRQILTDFGELAGEHIAPTANETDEVGNVLNDDNTVTYAPGVAKALKMLGERGMLGLTLPYRFGGLNCPNLLLTITNDIISRADASLMNLYGLQGIAETINAYADDEIKQAYLPDMAAGRKTGAMVLTEPDAGSDLQSVKVNATEQPDGTWRINGVKRFITNGCGDVLLVMARSEPEITDGRGLSLFLVEKGPHVRVRRLENKLGIHGSPTCELEFVDAPGRLVGERQQGLIKYVMALMYGARLGIAAQSCGIGEAAFRVARQYAHERKQFGTEIESFPAVRELLTESSVDLHAARALTYFASFCVDVQYGLLKKQEEDNYADDAERKQVKADIRTYKRYTNMLTPIAKYYASEMCMRVANHAIAVMGGNGYMHDYPLERHLRDSRITTIYEGTTQLQIVAAIGAVTTGTADALIEERLDRTWPSELESAVAELNAARKHLDEVVAFVKDAPDPNYRRLHARRIVDMAITLIVGALFCEHAAVNADRKPLLSYWIGTRLPELRKDREIILSGEQTALSAFETLAGGVPAMA